MRSTDKRMQVSLAAPDITERERKYVNQVLCGTSLSLGPRLGEFEARIARYVGCRYAVAVNSGTSALHLIVRALGIGAGDEVITTPFSFISSANCLLFEGARPVFVDIEEVTLNIEVEKIEEAITEKTKAILAVDVFGHPARWDRLEEIARRYNLRLVEDSAEALGSEFKGKKAGAWGEAAIFGFYPNKQITTGEGGIIVTDSKELATLCRSMSNQGRGKGAGWFEHQRLGYNYRLDELSAALGCVQMERIEEILEKRAKVAQEYEEKLAQMKEIEIPWVAPYVSQMSWFVYVVRLIRGIQRDKVITYLRKKGVECKPYFAPIHLQPFYRKMLGYQEGDFPVTEGVAARTIALPFYGNLREKEIDYVVECLKEGIRKGKS